MAKKQEEEAGSLKKKEKEAAAASLKKKEEEEEAAAASLKKKGEEEDEEEETAAASLKKKGEEEEEEEAAASLKKKEEEEEEAAAASLKKKEEEASLKKKEVEEEEAMRAMQEEEILRNLVGFRFHPTDTELVAHYLWSRIEGSYKFRTIQECDIYKYEPWDLPCDSFRFWNEDKEMYFFTPRYPFRGCLQRANRSTGNGCWRSYGHDKHIKVGSTVVGHRTSLSYKLLDEKKRETKTNWIMYEFQLQPPSNRGEDKKFYDLALCRIHEKKKSWEENDDVGLFAEERKAKREPVEEPEKQCLMDETGSLGSDTINTVSRQYEASSPHSTPRELQPVYSYIISDFLRGIVRKILHLGGCRTDADVGQSSKIRKATDEGNNNGDSSKRNKTQDMNTCHSSPGSSSGGRGRGRPHGSSLADKESARYGRFEDDSGKDSVNMVFHKQQDTATCHSSPGSSSGGRGRGLPHGSGLAAQDSVRYVRSEDDSGTDSVNNKPEGLILSEEGSDARKQKKMIDGTSSRFGGVARELDLNVALDETVDTSTSLQ